MERGQTQRSPPGSCLLWLRPGICEGSRKARSCPASADRAPMSLMMSSGTGALFGRGAVRTTGAVSFGLLAWGLNGRSVGMAEPLCCCKMQNSSEIRADSQQLKGCSCDTPTLSRDAGVHVPQGGVGVASTIQSCSLVNNERNPVQGTTCLTFSSSVMIAPRFLLGLGLGGGYPSTRRSAWFRTSSRSPSASACRYSARS